MKSFSKHYLAVVIAAACPFASAVADSIDTDEVVVTASPLVKNIESVNKPVNLLSGDDLKNASAAFKFASSVAWFGLKLRDSKLITDKESSHIVDLAKQGIKNDKDGYKAEFVRLVESVK